MDPFLFFFFFYEIVVKIIWISLFLSTYQTLDFNPPHSRGIQKYFSKNFWNRFWNFGINSCTTRIGVHFYTNPSNRPGHPVSISIRRGGKKRKKERKRGGSFLNFRGFRIRDGPRCRRFSPRPPGIAKNCGRLQEFHGGPPTPLPLSLFTISRYPPRTPGRCPLPSPLPIKNVSISETTARINCAKPPHRKEGGGGDRGARLCFVAGRGTRLKAS